MIRIAWFVLLLSLAGGAAGAETQVADDPAVRQALIARLEAFESYRAEFLQLVRDAGGNVIENAAGDFLLSKPNRFRWRYATPWPREIVADGTDLWLYDEDLDQVTVRPFAGVMEQTPAGILAGELAQLESYDISGEQAGGALTVVLHPRESRPDFTEVELRFNSQLLVAMQLVDQFGQVTRIRFDNAVLNPAPATADFMFFMPDGADLIDER